MSYTSVFFVGAAFSFVATFVVALVDNWSSGAAFITVVLLLTATFVGATWIGRLLQDWLPRPAAIGIAFVAVVYLGAAALVGWVGHANGPRCVDTDTMTVASSSLCQGTTPNGGAGVYAWYYGGESTDDGHTVTGGSFTAPDNGDDGGTGGGGVDSGDGDEGGVDGGGEG